MTNSPVFKCLPVIVRDKVVSSHTSGSVTATGQGRNISVSNTVSTNVILDVVLEFPDGDLLPIKLINESLHAPIGQKILMAFKGGEPIAYQVTPMGKVYPLGYTTNVSEFTLKDFGYLACFGSGTFFSGAMIFMDESYYRNGEMKPYSATKVVSALCLAGVGLATYVTKGWLGYIGGTAVASFPIMISCMIHNSKENAGRKEMLQDVAKKFEGLKSVLQLEGAVVEGRG
ncbi:hypothetical protein [Pseudomonas sichuanensis]|uniref:hypothetical protein n=1 Tax=Pseudomonas sichuanensis TaxID=2213015 RepID=UPI00215E56FE|nr:hypothetical protein [Pseudomonas sichuanensis]UVL90961.1 hypothetical protein LOY51_08795 [Pseudomonas sichuanensis]